MKCDVSQSEREERRIARLNGSSVPFPFKSLKQGARSHGKADQTVYLNDGRWTVSGEAYLFWEMAQR